MSKTTERTKKAIKDCYVSLLKEHEPSDITVSMICRECDINRSTFYEYYGYLDLLVKEVISDQIGKLSEYNDILYDRYYHDAYSNPDTFKSYIINFSNNEVLMRLIRSTDGNKFKAEITTAQCEYEIKRFKVGDGDEFIHTVYRNCGVTALVYRWIESNGKMDIDQLSRCLYEELMGKRM